MFRFAQKARRAFLVALAQRHQQKQQSSRAGMESLESRELLSSAHYQAAVKALNKQHHRGEALNTILFGQAPAAVQTGLDTDATDHSLTEPTSSTKVRLANVNGIETYSVRISDAGAVTTLTVDQLGDLVTAPTTTTTTFGTLSGTGTGSNTAASSEISTIASSLSLTAPTADTNVIAVTDDGKTTYSVRLQHSSTSNSKHPRGVLITVDSDGNPAGNEDVPFSVLPSAIQKGINANIPTGATALATDSTQTVNVRTIDGVVLYTTTFTTSGASTKVTVNSAGDAASLPTTTTTTFSALTKTVQNELQTLATANGVTTTIADTQSINVYTEANGTVLYSATLSATSTKNTSVTFDITITVDADGNPTTLPRSDLFGRFRGRRGFHGFAGGRGGGDFGGGSSGGSGSSNSGSNNSGGSSGSTGSNNGGLTIGSLAFLRR